MLTLEINDPNVESIFLEGFNANKEKFLEFIRSSYEKRESLNIYLNDKERFARTYTKMQNGSMEMILEEDSKAEIDTFLKKL